MSNRGSHVSPSKPPVTDNLGQRSPLRGSQPHVLSRAESLANAFAPVVTLNHARRKFREHFGAAFLQRTLTTRLKPATANHSKKNGTSTSRTGVGRTNATNQPTYVKLSLDAVALARMASRHARSTLVGKNVPLEVFVYYSNAARGCADDQYVGTIGFVFCSVGCFPTQTQLTCRLPRQVSESGAL